MPIIGKVNALPPEYSLKQMPIGAKGYISFYHFIITKKAIFIDLESPIVLAFPEDEEDEDDDFLKNFFPINRIGKGLTEDDYEIDFTKSDFVDILLDSTGTYYELIKETSRFLIFTDFKIGENSEHEEVFNVEKDEMTVLQEKLDSAIKDQRFIEADEIQKRIDELNAKDRDKKDKK